MAESDEERKRREDREQGKTPLRDEAKERGKQIRRDRQRDEGFRDRKGGGKGGKTNKEK